MRPRLAVLLVMGLALGAVLVVATPPGEAATSAVRNALFAKNAGAVNGIRASRTPRPNRLVPLNRQGKLPVSVIPASARVPGPAGERGPAGSAGAAGPAGRSALAPLQSGERIFGVYAMQGPAPNLWTGVTFPIPAAAPVDSRHVVLAGNDVVDGAGCTGTAADPVSAPGFVCVYPTQSVGTETGFGWGVDCACGDPAATGDGSRFGFFVQVNGQAPGLMTSGGTWVYTAP